MTSVTSAFTLLFLILLQFSSVPASFLSYPEARNSTPPEFSVRLINRNSVKSPFYNPKLTHYDRVKAAVDISIARQKYFQSKRFRFNDVMNPPVKPSDYEYLVKFSIGSPPVETFAVLDTASSLSWLQCRCPKPVLDHAKSSKSRKVPCKGANCKSLPNLSCQDSACDYSAEYIDRSISEGELAYETLTFEQSQSPPYTVNFSNIIVRCDNTNFRDEQPEGYPGVGVFGLNRGQLSVISQAGYGGFSYCLAPKDNPEAESSLHFHVNNNITGNSTPMMSRPNWDFLNMVGISLGDTRLAIPPESFKDGLVIDSRVPFTMLEHVALDTLQFEFGRWLGGRVPDPMQKFQLCYLTTDDQIARLPDITFHFTGMNFKIPPPKAWIVLNKTEAGTIYCLAILPQYGGYSILGNYQQQNVHVEYDWRKKLISLQPMDCNKSTLEFN